MLDEGERLPVELRAAWFAGSLRPASPAKAGSSIATFMGLASLGHRLARNWAPAFAGGAQSGNRQAMPTVLADVDSPIAVREPVLRPTPLSPDFDPLASRGRPAPSGFGGSLHPAAPEAAAPGFAGLLGCVARRPAQLRVFPRRSSEDALRFARSTDGPKAIPLRGRLGRFVRRRSFRGSLRSIRPKAFRASRFAPPRKPESFLNLAPSASLVRRPTRFPVSVVGAGRDHPKSLSIPGHRRPTKANAEASSFVCHLGTFPVSPFDGLDPRIAAATHDRPPEDFLIMFGPQLHRPTVSLARSFSGQRG